MENTTAGFWLSPQQKYLWSLQQEGGRFAVVSLISMEGPLQLEKLQHTFEQVISRQEILRTVYRRQAGMKIPFQVILDDLKPSLETVDLSALSEAGQRDKINQLLQRERSRAIDVEAGPIVFATLAKISTDRLQMILNLPALCCDPASVANLLKELGEAYSGCSSTEEPFRYVQFAQWQNDLLESEDESAIAGKNFWKKQLVSEATAPTVHSEIKFAGKAFAPQSGSSAADLPIFKKMEALAEKSSASLPDVLLAAWQSLLWRLGGQNNFIVGTAFAGREYEELQGALGLLAKTLPIPARFDGDFTFTEVVAHVRDSMHQSAEWQEHFVPGTGLGGEAPVEFEFSEAAEKQQHDDLSFELLEQYACWDRFKLKLSVVRSEVGLRLEFYYDSARFEQRAIEQLAGYFQNLLRAALEQPDTRVSRLPLLGKVERHQLLTEWNQTAADYPADLCLHQLFEAQAARTPDRPAIRFNDKQLSYRELNEAANQMAHHLRSLGVKPDSLVGLCLERSAEMMVALLAILKAGGAYVPLNPDNPKPRLAQQLAGAVALITEQKLLPQMPAFAGTTLVLDRDQPLWSNQPHSNPDVNTTPENLVYVIYTSGSTGVPKGVAVRHRNLVNYSHFITQRLDLAKYPDGLQFATVSTIGADLGNTCIYPALISGGCLQVIAYEVSTDAQRFAHYAQQHPIDVLKIVPSHLQALLHSSDAAQVLPRQYLITGGETLTPQLIEKIQSLRPGCQILNHYGPTETTVGSLTLRLNDYDWKHATATSIPIGLPIANTQVYILDEHLEPVPVGVVGELYIAGAGVTAGYLNQPERTAERFLKNPFVNDPQAKMYRTGDLARYHEDGNIEFLGRGDDQVKIRGFRIELGEIESILAQHPGVKQAVVLAKEDDRGDKRLLAYVVAGREQDLTADSLRGYLKDQLPDYMVPSAIVLLPKLPLTANGKIDRQALPEPEQVEAKAYVAPRTPTEEVVANIWAEVLRREKISVEDNFFDLGGHSLLATQVISRVRRTLNVDIPLRTLFETPTVARISEQIEKAKAQARPLVPPIIRIPRNQPLPLSFAQQRLWVLDQLEPNNPLYNIPRTLRMQGRLNVEALHRTLN